MVISSCLHFPTDFILLTAEKKRSPLYIYKPHFLCPALVGGHLGWFRAVALRAVFSAAVNVHVQVLSAVSFGAFLGNASLTL